MSLVVAVDGGNGTGKSTLLELLSERLRSEGFKVMILVTGHLYRALGILALRYGGSEQAAKAISASSLIALATRWETVLLDGAPFFGANRIPNHELRRPEVSRLASHVASKPEVRAWCTDRFREAAVAFEGIVLMDGRDCGTNIVPDAPIKLVLTVSPVVSAERQGLDVEAVIARDVADAKQSVPAPDAYVFDTSYSTKEETAGWAYGLVHPLLA